tara:strand:- start:469 stop:963 length:495 start_codon:yes stop_codon:yes gene_type:complete
MRHGKSDWESYLGNDFSRNISEIGIKKTNFIGSYLQKEKIRIKKIICSPSTRTRETMELVLKYLDCKPEIEFVEKIYSGNEIDLLKVLKSNKNSCTSILVIGHEPTLSSFIETISDDINNSIFKKATWKFSTSSLFNFCFETNQWDGISSFNSEIKFYLKPKIL